MKHFFNPFLIFLILLSGCAAKNIDESFTLDANKGTGVAVVSIVRSGIGSFSVFADFKSIDGTYKNSIPITDLFASSDWECPMFGNIPYEKPCGRLAIIELPQGDYTFYAWHGSAGNAYTVHSTTPFSKPFKIVAGKATYLGNIHFAIQYSAFKMIITDQQDKDLPLLYHKAPNITEQDIILNVLPK